MRTLSPGTTVTSNPQEVANALAACPPLLRRRITYRADVLVDEFLTAVRAAQPSDHPLGGALAALPAPVPYLNPDLGNGRRALAARALTQWLAPRVELETDDPAVAATWNQLQQLDLTLLRPDHVEAAEKWAGDCARLLSDPRDRSLAFSVSLLVNSLLREDDDTLVRQAAQALVTARGESGFLQLRELCDGVHEQGFTDRVG